MKWSRGITWRTFGLVALVAFAAWMAGGLLTEHASFGAVEVGALITSTAAGVTCLVALYQAVTSARATQRAADRQEECTPYDVEGCFAEAYRRTKRRSRPTEEARVLINQVEARVYGNVAKLLKAALETPPFEKSETCRPWRMTIDSVLHEMGAYGFRDDDRLFTGRLPESLPTSLHPPTLGALYRPEPGAWRRPWGKRGWRHRRRWRIGAKQMRHYINHLRDVLDDVPLTLILQEIPSGRRPAGPPLPASPETRPRGR